MLRPKHYILAATEVSTPNLNL